MVKITVARKVFAGRGLALEEPPAHLSNLAYALAQGQDGRLYSSYPLFTSLVHATTVAVEMVGGPIVEGLPWMLVLAALAAMLVTWGKRSGASPEAASVGAALVCLGTPLWPMSALGYDNLAEVLTLAVLLWAGTGPDRSGAWLMAGLAVGLSFATRVSTVVLAVPALILLWGQSPRGFRAVVRRTAAVAIGSVPGLTLALAYNHYRFGSVLESSGTALIGTRASDYVLPLLSGLHLTGVTGLLVSPGKGAIWYGPPLAAAVVLIIPVARRYPTATGAMGSYALAAVVFFGSFTFWHGDWNWGPRYVAPLYLLVAPFAWWTWDWLKRRRAWVRGTALLALISAVGFQALPVILGDPVSHYIELAVAPLARLGLLETRPMYGAPIPADYDIHYFTLRHSPLVVVFQAVARALADPVQGGVWWLRVVLVSFAPLCAGALVVLATWRNHPGSSAATQDSAAG